MFIVIDYPEERTELVGDILSRLKRWQERDKRCVHVLFLTRDERAGQLNALLERHDLLGALDRELTLPLLGALDEEAAVRLALDVRKAVGGAEAFPARIEEEAFATACREWLRGDPGRHGMPLMVIAASLHAMSGEEAGFSLSGEELLEALARREARRAREVSRAIGLGDNGLPRLVALATLAGGLEGADIARLADAPGLGDAKKPDEDLLRETSWWRAASGERAGRLAPLEPDRPAAAFVAHVLLSDPHNALPEWLWLALKGREKEREAAFIETLPRLASDLFAAGAGNRLVEALTEMVKDNPERAAAFRAVTERNGTALTAAFPVVICEVLLKAAGDTAGKALVLNNMSVHLAALGRHDEALAAAEEAAGHYRALAKQDADAYLPDLAKSMNNLLSGLAALGRHDEALAVAEEAARHCRELAKQDADTYLPDLAMSLNNLSNILAALGRYEEALEVAEESLKYRRELAERNAAAYLPASLNNLSNILAALGRHDEALAAAEESVGHYRELAVQNAAAYGVGLARLLMVRALALTALERHGEAADAIAEAVRTLRPRFLELPQAHAGLMAMMLKIYMACHEAAGREPDVALLGPLVEQLERMNEGR